MRRIENTSTDNNAVLLLDANAEATEPLLALFQLAGFRALSRGNGKSGIVAAVDHAPDFVVMSLALPDLDGCAVARVLRSLPGFQSTPIIALSGFGDLRSRRRAMAAGFDAYFCKPVDFEDLRANLAGRDNRRR